MPFNGGGGGALPAHEHTNAPLDGGPLDFQNTTIASLNAGSTTFSDGAALQELVIGNAGDSLVVNAGATAPEWGTAGGTWIADGTAASTTGAASLSVTGMVGRDITQVLFHVCEDPAVNGNLQMRVNGVATGTYCSRFYDSDGGNNNVNNITQYRLTNQHATGCDYVGCIYIMSGNANLNWTGNQIRTSISVLNSMVATPHTDQIIMGSGNQPDTNNITQVEMMNSTGNITGNIQVNSMDYQ
jgi:hypothetical protein|tara:strand:- start:104 stop:829 length:726 start_codon:yes stop_codon:yes gene_type:complete